MVEAAAGVSSPDLAALLRDHWAWVLRTDPLRSTQLGVHDHDHRLPDQSEAGIAEGRAARRSFLARAQALNTAGWSEDDRVTLQLLVRELSESIAAEVCAFETWNLSPRDNPITNLSYLPELHRVRTPGDAARLLSRYRGMPRLIDDEIANLRRGAAQGLFATAESTKRIVDMTDKQLAQPLDDWPLMAPAKAAHDDWPAAELAAFRAELRAVVEGEVRPAFARYGALLEGELLPGARPDDRSGLSFLPVGAECYPARIEAFTTLPLSAEEVHRIGLEQIAALDVEIAELGHEALGTRTLAETLERLRTDASLYFRSEAEVEQAAEEALAASRAAMGAFFGILPRADCIVRRIPDYEAPYTTIAYYQPPHPDGSKPGEYYVNVLNPSTRPRFEARVLAVHEAIPGHHLQIAISQERTAVPAFRKHGGITVYVEGWALYTERLAEEMGLYRDDLDRIGVLSFDAWRAGRLVVDTGIHHLGWSRSRARAYLQEHTALSPENIDNEVDRYIAWPGQALGYKIGQLEIWKLRREAEAALGDRFALPAFHDVVLASGAVSLPMLRARVEAYVAAAK